MRAIILPVSAVLLLVSAAASASPCRDGDDTTDDCKEYEAFVSPGGTAQFFAPHGAKQPYFGGGFQIAAVQWAHDNNDYGPARGAVFFQASLLQSPVSEHVMGIYEGGMTLAFERNANRRFAIPYFGFTMGGITQTGERDAGFFQPVAGMHVFWNPNVVVDVSGGYVFPFVKVDDLRGFRAQASLRIHLW